MKRYLLAAVFLAVAVVPSTYVGAHCEVPCGIYGDDARFQAMFEDQTLLSAKAISEIGALAGKHEANSLNQLTRWVNTKEDHATKVQHTIAQYFMTQRIKADDAKYVEKLTKAHAVMVAAMKCKQAADPATAEVLHDAIHAFQEAYNSK